MPLANRSNVVVKQLPTLLYVTCCVRLQTLCCMLLRVDSSCCAKFETGQTLHVA